MLLYVFFNISLNAHKIRIFNFCYYLEHFIFKKMLQSVIILVRIK